MDRELTTKGLDAKTLAQLWALGAEGEGDPLPQNADQIKVDLLQNRLAQKVPLERALTELLPKVFAMFCADIQPFTGSSFQTLLSNPDTDVSTLKTGADQLAQQLLDF